MIVIVISDDIASFVAKYSIIIFNLKYKFTIYL